MSFGERLPPPPGFGAAAAGHRPSRMDFGGSKSATRTNTMVNIKTETDNGNLEVLQQSQMQEAMASQSSCQTKSSLRGDKDETTSKGPYTRSRVDATKVGSPGVNASNTGHHLRPCKKRKGLGKHVKLEDNQGATELSRPPTPINLFDDECVFCHSFRTTEKFHGPMVRYREGRIVSSDEGNLTNAIYVHKKCMVWAPRVFLNGDKFVNVEKEISRASRLKCSRCRLPGAALGCYHHPCANTYHVPCAMMIPKCDWDIENLHVWCPKHASDPLPCDEMSSPVLESDIPSPIVQNPCQAKEQIFIDCHMQDKQINPLVTLDSVLGQYLDTQRMHVIHRREDQQVDQPNTSSSFSLPPGQCSSKEGISADYRREEKQTNQSRTPVNQWVLLGSVLSASEKVSLKEFASLTMSALAEQWDKNVTHVIVGRSAGNACGKSYEVLMGILSGKWVLRAGWIVDCLVEPIPSPKSCLIEPIPGPETSYEVKFYNGVRASIDGPMKGRAAAAERAPKLFSGLYFCLSSYLNPEYKENIKTLIAAAEGQVLEGISPRSLLENLGKNPAKVYFICDGDPPRDYASALLVDKEIEGIKYVAPGARVISHLWLFDAIASYDTRMLERSYRCSPGM